MRPIHPLTPFRAAARLGLLLALTALPLTALLRPAPAFAHGDEDHSEEAAPAATVATPNTAANGATQTELELRLSDLVRGTGSTPVALQGATVQGFLKRADTGEILAPVEARAEDTPGVYSVYFNGNQTHYAFPKAGRYALQLAIQPKSGEAVDATVEFSLAAPAPVASVPLWRRALPVAGGALLGAALLAFAFRMLKRRRKNAAQPVTPTAERVTTTLLLLVVAGSLLGAGRAGAHGDEDHSEEEAAPAASATTSTTTNIATGETSATAKAGNIGIALTARTRAATPPEAEPGTVQLAPQTAQLLDIQTRPVEVAQLSTGVSFSGQLAPAPNGQVRVASVVPGRVTRLSVAPGDTVRQGQVVAVVESRAVGEAQSAFAGAQARFGNAQSNLRVVEAQARAGVFARTPLEAARRSAAEARGDVREAEAGVAQARVALDNVTRLARVGGFANPALEAARAQSAQAREAVRTASAALDNARSAVRSGEAELARRRQLASSGAFTSRPVEEARRAQVTARASRETAESEVATTRANLVRARTLAAEGLISQRDLEAAQTAFQTAESRLETARSDESTAGRELERQQTLSRSNVAGTAEVAGANATLATARADVRTRAAELERARTGVRLAEAALRRERAIFGGQIANRREIGTARANLQAAQATLYKARETARVAETQLAREGRIFRQGLNNTAQVQAARSGLASARAELGAAQSALSLLQSSPTGSARVSVRAPIGGVVQSREASPGELVEADAPLLTVVNLQTLALDAQVFEADFARVRPGQSVTVTTPALPGRTFTGRIATLGASVDPQTRTVSARAIIANPGALRPGLFARGQVQTGVGSLSPVVPASAVLDDGAAKIVFVARGDAYERREVRLGREQNGRVEVRSGVRQGERVVVRGASALRAQAARGS